MQLGNFCVEASHTHFPPFKYNKCIYIHCCQCEWEEIQRVIGAHLYSGPHFERDRASCVRLCTEARGRRHTHITNIVRRAAVGPV